jgi:hypothetical protein
MWMSVVVDECCSDVVWEKGRKEERKGKEKMINKQPQRLGNAVSAKRLEAKEVEDVGRTIARLQGAVSWVSSRTTCPPSQTAAEGVGQSSI